MLKYRDQGNPEEREEVNVSTNLISHEDAACALELALRNVEQQAAPTLTDLMFIGVDATLRSQE
ncbi:hypothetical protein AVEN_148476-1, partial [Araneus ventricosus]